MRCANCGFDNPKKMKYCGNCGTRIDAAPRSRFGSGDAGPAGTHQYSGERRQVTVMFCDLVGSTVLSERLDPEDLRAVIETYLSKAAAIVQRFGGYVAQYLGDGLLAYFGYPSAHEDDAQRAVESALMIVKETQQLQLDCLRQVERRLATRIGIHTGLVVAGDMEWGGDVESPRVIGSTPNVAARLQGLAEPNGVIISGATCRLIEGLFECAQLGERALKGVERPMPVYQVQRPGLIQRRFEVAVRKGLTPLVGREDQVRKLDHCWRETCGGHGSTILLSGEAGVGKSRLVQAFTTHFNTVPHTLLMCQCSSHYQSSALFPLIRLLQEVFGIHTEHSVEEQAARAIRGLEQTKPPMSAAVPLILELLSLPLPDTYTELETNSAAKRQQTLELLTQWLMNYAAQRPVVFVVEDLHWADPTTLEFLNGLLQENLQQSILVLLTFRTSFEPPWPRHSNWVEMRLERLGFEDSWKLVKTMTGGHGMSADVHRRIVEKTNGIPLFIEELTRMMLESGRLTDGEGGQDLNGSSSRVTIPTTLQDSLMERLDRLETAKEIAQVGAVIDEEFDYALLAAVVDISERLLYSELCRLVQAGLMYQTGSGPRSRYGFRHALIQEAAYQSLLKSKRHQYHKRVTQVLESNFPHICEARPEILAYHYTAAGLLDQAIATWLQAGEKANRQSAHVEAARHLSKGLELLRTLPQSAATRCQELELQVALGTALTATKGYAVPEVEQAYHRAHELCLQLDDRSKLFAAVFGLWRVNISRARLQEARRFAEHLLTLTAQSDNTVAVLTAHGAQAITLLFLGQLTAAEDHFAQAIALYDPQAHGYLGTAHGQDPGLTCIVWSAVGWWLRGYPDKAQQLADTALVCARRQAHSFNLAYTLRVLATLYQLRRDVTRAGALIDELIDIGNREGFQYLLMLAKILQGWVRVQDSGQEQPVLQTRDILRALDSTESGLGQCYFFGLLAQMYHRIARTEEGLGAIDEGLSLARLHNEHWCEAELLGIKGDLLGSAANPDLAQAEAHYQSALESARTQGALALELRNGLRLAKLWIRNGRQRPAHMLLADIYERFTEGWDSPDLIEAQSLLKELAAG